MRFAIIIHPLDLDQVRRIYPFVKRIPASLLTRFISYLPPVKTGIIKTAAGDLGDVICCPLLPCHFKRLGQKYLRQKIISCLRKAEQLGAQVVGLEGLTAFFLEEGQGQKNPIKASLTSGLRLRTQALLTKARQAAKSLGIPWSQAEVVLISPSGQEGETWAALLARETKTLTLLQTRVGREQDFAGRIMYETGLALKVTANAQLALSKADIVFLHQVEPEFFLEIGWYKAGSVICSIVPGRGWGDLDRKREDLVYLESILLEAPPGITCMGGYNLSAGVSPALAETIIMAQEQCKEWFWPGREITIKQVETMGKLAEKYGFQGNPGVIKNGDRG